MTLPVRISEEAEAEMAEAARWYDTHRAGLGFEFLNAVGTAVAGILESPRMGSVVPGVSDPAIRRKPVRRFPYHLVYMELSDRLQSCSTEAPTFDARRYDPPIGGCCGSAAAAPVRAALHACPAADWKKDLMLAIEIMVNGKRRVVAPVSGMGLMIAGIHAGNRLAEEPTPGKPKVLEDYVELNVGGVTETEHQSWVSALQLELGDEIVMRIVDAERADHPEDRSPRREPE